MQLIDCGDDVGRGKWMSFACVWTHRVRRRWTPQPTRYVWSQREREDA